MEVGLCVCCFALAAHCVSGILVPLLRVANQLVEGWSPNLCRKYLSLSFEPSCVYREERLDFFLRALPTLPEEGFANWVPACEAQRFIAVVRGGCLLQCLLRPTTRLTSVCSHSHLVGGTKD